MKYEKIGKGCMIALIVIVLILSIFNYVRFIGYEEICIANECSEWAYGNEWIKDNCELNKDNKYEICEFDLEGKRYRMKLDSINISQVKSCRDIRCATKIFVKTGGIK